MFKWLRHANLEPLGVSMAGAKLGDRVLVLGCGDPLLIAGVAAKAGLTGQACAIDTDAGRVAHAAQIALAEGTLVESSTGPLDALPFAACAFDLVILRDVQRTGGAAAYPAVVQQAHRVVRPGGRCLAIETVARSGLGAFFGTAAPTEASAEAVALAGVMKADGFVAVRVLAEREGLIFVEGVKRNA